LMFDGLLLLFCTLALHDALPISDWMLHEIVERSVWLEANAWIIGAGTLLLAGGFQFSRFKYRCLDKCRAPLSFVMEYWRGRHDQDRKSTRLNSSHQINSYAVFRF